MKYFWFQRTRLQTTQLLSDGYTALILLSMNAVVLTAYELHILADEKYADNDHCCHTATKPLPLRLILIVSIRPLSVCIRRFVHFI